MRAWMSIAPPGGFGTTRLTVRLGNAWAAAPPASARSATRQQNRRRIISCIVDLGMRTGGMRFAPAQAELEQRADGSMLLRSPQKLGPYARCVTEWLVEWSDRAPSRDFLAERKGEGWRRLSYREAYGAVRRIGQALLERGLGARSPVAILSDNGIDHALLALGAMHAGVPVAPVSPAYSLMSKDFGKLRYIFDLVKPG